MTKQAKCNSNRVVGALVMLLVLASSEPVGVAGVWLMRVMGTVAVAVVMWEIYKTKTGEKIVEQETLFDLFYALFAMDYKGE